MATYQARGLHHLSALAGAGAGIARKFALEGFKVALVSRKQETLVPIAQEIADLGGQALSVPADTGKPPARQLVCQQHFTYKDRGTKQPLRRTFI